MSHITTDAPVVTLHPLITSPAYPAFLRSRVGQRTTSERLAADYIEAVTLGASGAVAAIERALFGYDGDSRHLQPIQSAIRNMVPSTSNKPLDTEGQDLLSVAFTMIVEKLRGPRAIHATVNWKQFCDQCVIDAHRHLFGRNAHKLDADLVRLLPDGADPTEEDGVVLTADSQRVDAEAFEAVVVDMLSRMPEGPLRLVAADRFGPDPSFVSGAKPSKIEGKPPLLDQLGWEQTATNRDKVYVLINDAKHRFAAALLRADRDGVLDIDLHHVQQWLTRKQ